RVVRAARRSPVGHGHLPHARGHGRGARGRLERRTVPLHARRAPRAVPPPLPPAPVLRAAPLGGQQRRVRVRGNAMLVKGYRVFMIAVLGLYAFAGFTGYRRTDAERDKVDPSVRSSPGGYRSFHFWHSGYAGGK